MLIGDPVVDAMLEDVMGRAELGLIKAMNIAAEEIDRESQLRVPEATNHDIRHGSHRGARPMKPLKESSHVDLAEPGNPRAVVWYEGPYAAAQEVGKMTYESKKGKTVEWQAHNYTKPGTGAHYLSDAFKMVAGKLEVEVSLQSRIQFGEIAGPRGSKSAIRSASSSIESGSLPIGQEAAAMRQQEGQVASAPVGSFKKAAGGGL